MSQMAWMDDQKHWGLVAAAWGDVLCSIAAVQDAGLRKVIYVGHMQAAMKEFLEAQPGIDHVVAVHTTELGISYHEWLKIWGHFVDRSPHSDEMLSLLFKTCNVQLSPAEIYNACLDHTQFYQPNRQSQNLILPTSVHHWVKILQKQRGLRDYVLVNPYSLNSTSWESHWPHWKDYLDWLVGHEDIQFVFVGLDYEPTRYRGRSNVVDLVGKTPTMMHAMGLASHAAAVITTISGMAHWCNSQDIRCVAMHNKPADRPHDVFERICTSDQFYKIWFRDPLRAGIAATQHALDLSGNGPIAREIDRNLWVEECHSMTSLYNRMPAIPYTDFSGDWAQASDGFDLMRRIAQAVQPESYYEIGARVGHGLLAFCAGSSRMQRVGWCDNESYVRNSNKMICRNLDFFGARYHRPVEYSYVTDIHQVSAHLMGYQVVTVDGEHTRAGKIRDLDMALGSGAELILVDDYFYLPVVRYAIREWAIANKQPLHLIHTFRGLVAFDTTPDRRHIERLRAQGIACDLITCDRARY